MKKARRVLLVSILIFLALLTYYIYRELSSREPVVSEREVYQHEMHIKEEEGWK